MNYLRTGKKAGIDYWIDRHQTDVYEKLKIQFGINNDTAYDCYGRIYRNNKGDGYIPEAFISGNNYHEVLWDARMSAQSFYIYESGEESRHQGQNDAKVSFVFMCNLQKLCPSSDREDEWVRSIVKDSVDGMQGFYGKKLFLGYDKVFSDFSGDYMKRLKGKFPDMHPNHCFRIEMAISYVSMQNDDDPINQFQFSNY